MGKSLTTFQAYEGATFVWKYSAKIPSMLASDSAEILLLITAYINLIIEAIPITKQ